MKRSVVGACSAALAALAWQADASVVATVVKSPLEGLKASLKPARYDFTVIDVARGPSKDNLSPYVANASIDDAGFVLWRDEGPDGARLRLSNGVIAPLTVVDEAAAPLTLVPGSHNISNKNRHIVFEAFAPDQGRNEVFTTQGGSPIRLTGKDTPAVVLFETPPPTPAVGAPPLPSNASSVDCAGRCGISNSGTAGFLLKSSTEIHAVATATPGQFLIGVPDDQINEAPVTLSNYSDSARFITRRVGDISSLPDTLELAYIEEVLEWRLKLDQKEPSINVAANKGKIVDYAYGGEGEAQVAVIEPLEGDLRPFLFWRRNVAFTDGPFSYVVADTVGPLAQLSDPSLNESRKVVFEATYDIAPSGAPTVFDGGDPAAARVLGPGSILFGELVEQVDAVNNDALNESGQIALSVLTRDADGNYARYVLRADPAPENFVAAEIGATLHGLFGDASLSQNFAAPAEAFDLSFDLDWLGGEGLLQVVLNDVLLAEFGPDDSARWTLGGLTGRDDGGLSTLEFLLSGAGSLRLDTIMAPGLRNGGFDDGDLSGWEAEGGVHAEALAFAPVPLPAAAGLLPTGLIALAALGRANRRRGA